MAKVRGPGPHSCRKSDRLWGRAGADLAFARVEFLIVRPPLKARRSAERLLTSAPRRAPATLTWYFAGAGLLAVAATAGLVALERRSAPGPSTATRAEAPAAAPATRPSPTTPAPKPVAAARPAPATPAPPLQASPPPAPAPATQAAAPRPAPLAFV